MIDSGASRNFISKEEAMKLNLSLEESSSQVKTVNSEAKRVSCVAKNIPIKIGDWSRKLHSWCYS